MNYILDTWNEENILEYYNEQTKLIGDKKSCEWEQKIINTSLPCYGKTASKATKIAKQIKKGNFIEFLDKVQIKTFFDSIVVACLICYIKDFNLFKEKLEKYVLTIDNWASSDKLDFKRKEKEELYLLSKKFLKSDKPFVRRTALNFYFKLISEEKYVDKVFEVLDGLKEETEYYVNMCAAWLLCDCFIKYREKTLNYFKRNNTNAFIINKGISKCRDSFRVSKEDKDLLLNYKR